MSNVEIRTATPADLPAITDIYDDEVLTGTATFELTPPGLAEMTRRFHKLREDGLPYLVALSEGQVAGYAYAGPYHARPAYRFTLENSVYLASAYRRRGIGRRLLNELIVQSEARGCRQMVAVIGDFANAASISLHASTGFQMMGTFKSVGFKFGRWLDTVLMQRTLGEGGTTLPRD